MQISQLDALTYVGPQISIGDLNELKRLKIRTVIVVRPEGESIDQPTIYKIHSAADALGITVHQIPVVPGEISDNDLRAFDKIRLEADHAVFAYCRSGMRATTLWALNAAKQGKSSDEILRMTTAAGFDLSALADRLSAQVA